MNRRPDKDSSDSSNSSPERRSPKLSIAAIKLLSYFLFYPRRDATNTEALSTTAASSSLFFRSRIRPSNHDVFLMAGQMSSVEGEEKNEEENNTKEQQEEITSVEVPSMFISTRTSSLDSSQLQLLRPALPPLLNGRRKSSHRTKSKTKRKKMNRSFAQRVFIRNNAKTPIRRPARLESFKCELRGFRSHQSNVYGSDQAILSTNISLQQLPRYPHFASISLPALPTYSTPDDDKSEPPPQLHQTNEQNTTTSAPTSCWVLSPNLRTSITTDKYHGPDLFEQYRKRKRPPIRNYCTTNHPLRQMYSLEDLVRSDTSSNIEESKYCTENTVSDENTHKRSKLTMENSNCKSPNLTLSGDINTPVDQSGLGQLSMDQDYLSLNAQARISVDDEPNVINNGSCSISSSNSNCSRCCKYHSSESATTCNTTANNSACSNLNLPTKPESDVNVTCTTNWKTKLRQTFHILKTKFKNFFHRAVNR